MLSNPVYPYWEQEIKPGNFSTDKTVIVNHCAGSGCLQEKAFNVKHKQLWKFQGALAGGKGTTWPWISFFRSVSCYLFFSWSLALRQSDFLPTKRILENQCCFTCWSFSQNTGGQILSFELCSLQICFKCLKAEVEKIKLYFKIPENSWSAGPFCCGNHCLECSLPFLWEVSKFGADAWLVKSWSRCKWDL